MVPRDLPLSNDRDWLNGLCKAAFASSSGAQVHRADSWEGKVDVKGVSVLLPLTSMRTSCSI